MAAKEKPGPCTLTPGCSKYSGHEKDPRTITCMDEDLQPLQPPAESADEKESRYPLDPADWRARHYLSLLGRFERAWDACPPSKRHILKEMVLELVGETKQGSLPL